VTLQTTDRFLGFKGQEQDVVYDVLAHHQILESWGHRELAIELHRWVAIFEEEFQLGIPEISLGVDRLRITRLGHFHPGHNGLGLKGEIVVNELYIGERAEWETLGTLLHEMLHAWQQAHGQPGKRNYHNKQFREKARTLGLLIDERGYTEYVPDSPFTRLLDRHGVVASLDEPALRKKKSRRGDAEVTLKRWFCGCTNVRVAVRSFRARCLNCGNEFELII
jgi:hypothetical protein